MLKDNGNLQIRGDIIKQNTNVYGLMFLVVMVKPGDDRYTM